MNRYSLSSLTLQQLLLLAHVPQLAKPMPPRQRSGKRSDCNRNKFQQAKAQRRKMKRHNRQSRKIRK